MKKIEKNAPMLTGNPEEDVRLLASYVTYLREQINYILTLIDRRFKEEEANNGN